MFITNIGRKGGYNVAAAVVNAMAILAGEITKIKGVEHSDFPPPHAETAC